MQSPLPPNFRRIYATAVLDGYGDLFHLIDRASCNQDLPAEIKAIPEFYYVQAYDDQKPRIMQILDELPSEHPLSKANRERNQNFLLNPPPSYTHHDLEDTDSKKGMVKNQKK